MSIAKQIQQLSFPFVKNGWTHELVLRKWPVLLVRRYKTAVNSGFEVVVARHQPERVWRVAGNEIRASEKEAYPRSEDWGRYGFTYMLGEETKAREKFEALVKFYSGND